MRRKLRIGVLFAFAMALIGILWLPSDLKEAPTAAKEWLRLFRMIDREIALWFVSSALLGWLGWVEFRPFILRRLKIQKKHPIRVSKGTICESYKVKDDQIAADIELYGNVYYLAVSNISEDGKTLRRVQARIYFVGPPRVCPIKDHDSKEIDIRHGEWAFFEMGRIFSPENNGQYSGALKVESGLLESVVQNVERGVLGFELAPLDKQTLMLHSTPPLEGTWTPLVIISADDVKAREAVLHIKMTKEKQSVIAEPRN